MKRLIITVIGAVAILGAQSTFAGKSSTGYPLGSAPVLTLVGFDSADSSKYDDWELIDSISTDTDDDDGDFYDLLTSGNDFVFSDNGRKWECGKAGKIKYKYNKKDDYETWSVSGNTKNLSGLKLSFNTKKKTFSGSFKVYLYNFDKHKVKSVTAKIKGSINSEGYGVGTATISKYGSWEVSIGPSDDVDYDYDAEDYEDEDDKPSTTKPSYSGNGCALCGTATPVTPSKPSTTKPSYSGGCALCGD